MNTMLPDDPLFMPELNVTVLDNRLGGFLKPVVGRASVPLAVLFDPLGSRCRTLERQLPVHTI